MTALLDHHVGADRPTPDRPRHRLLGSERLGVLALLAATAAAYLWSLGASGYANSFYAAAVQAGSQSWKAFLFGSLDAGNSITVDKPPGALWVMDLSVRLFGLSSWSILVPEALMGVATVGLVYATVRRVAGHQAALMAGAATALTPSAALMFRFDNPDAMLLLLLTGAGYATLRAAEMARGRWLVLAGVLVGLAFLTKMLQAFLILPALVVAYLIAAPAPLRTRALHLVGAAAAVLASAGWWIALVELWPASDRPYIDGSTDNNILQLVLGYNGLGRLTGVETGGLGNAGFSSGVGPLRLFEGVSGGMVAWLLPAALLLLVAALVTLGHAPRTDRTRAALVISGGSMLVTATVFSFMAGIYHDYYTVALAPWIAMTTVLGAVVLWRRRDLMACRTALALAVAATAVWAFVLLGQSAAQPYDTLRWPVLLLGLLAAGAFLFSGRLNRRVAAGLLVATGLIVSVGPAAYSAQTIGTPHSGSIVTAGPYAGGSGFGGGPAGARGGGFPGGQTGHFPGGPPGPTGGAPGGMTGGAPGGMAGGAPGGMAGGAPGGGSLLDGAEVSSEMTTLLQTDASSYTWVAATVRAQGAASYQLATGDPVMAIGGFNGTTASPTLAQFEQYVSQGRIHYFIAGSETGAGFGGAGGSTSGSETTASQITSWVERTFTAKTVGGTTVYDLSQPVSGASGSASAGESA